jgi:hypothetical protein
MGAGRLGKLEAKVSLNSIFDIQSWMRSHSPIYYLRTSIFEWICLPQLQSSIFHLPFPETSALALQIEVSENQNVHLRPQKTIERLFGMADNRFVFVERCIQDERNPRQLAKLFD